MGYWGKGRKNIGDCKRVLLSLQYPSIGSHRWLLYVGGGVGVCEVNSDEGWGLINWCLVQSCGETRDYCCWEGPCR